MKKYLFAVVTALLSVSAFSALQATNGKDVAILYDTPCTNAKALALVPEQFRAVAKRAEVFTNKQKYNVCAVVLEQRGAVAFQYDDGDVGVIPLADFRERGV